VNKKKQKILLLRAVAIAGPNPTISRSFLVLFFKKELLPLLASVRLRKLETGANSRLLLRGFHGF
jgi:hypothetical protein